MCGDETQTFVAHPRSPERAAWVVRPAASRRSMIEQKFTTIEQGPEEVCQGLGGVLLAVQGGDEPVELGPGRLAGEAADVELGDPLLGELLGGDELGDEPALLDLGVDSVAVEQVEGLREGRLHLDLAR